MPLRSTQESSGRPLADSGLRCPACEYNLTGVTENRCPECGTGFEWEHLRAILAGAPAPIPIWDDRRQNLGIRFAKMCLLAWFNPTRLARMLPRRYSRASARRFQNLVLLVALLVAGVPTLIVVSLDGSPAVWLNTAAIVLGIGAGCWAGLTAFELMADTVCELEAPGAVARPETTWEGQAGFFRSFILIQAMLVAGPAIAAAVDSFPDILFVCVSVVFVWWWICLSLAMAERAGGLQATILLLPIMAGLGGLVAVVIGIPAVAMLVLLAEFIASAVTAG